MHFFNLTIKKINDLAMFPNILGRVVGTEPKKLNETAVKAYGGFTNSDWQKVGNDMKRGLITFGKTKS